MSSKLKIGLIGVFVLFLILFNAPFLSIPTGVFSGLPKVMIYIGSCWIILIILMGIVDFRNRKKNNHLQ